LGGDGQKRVVVGYQAISHGSPVLSRVYRVPLCTDSFLVLPTHPFRPKLATHTMREERLGI
jgi:hypothetical protein